MSIDDIRKITLSLPEVKEEPHFEKTSFRVSNKIFTTALPNEGRATVKLSTNDQDLFCLGGSNAIYPVPNKWGKQGWTHINLNTVQQEMLTGILKAAYCEVAPKHLASRVPFEED